MKRTSHVYLESGRRRVSIKQSGTRKLKFEIIITHFLKFYVIFRLNYLGVGRFDFFILVFYFSHRTETEPHCWLFFCEVLGSYFSDSLIKYIWCLSLKNLNWTREASAYFSRPTQRSIQKGFPVTFRCLCLAESFVWGNTCNAEPLIKK